MAPLMTAAAIFAALILLSKTYAFKRVGVWAGAGTRGREAGHRRSEPETR